MKFIVSLVCLASFTASCAAIERVDLDAAQDTLSPAYDLATFPYSWKEIQAGAFSLAPTHWERFAGNPVIENGMNARPVWWDDKTIRVYFGTSGPRGGLFYFDVDPDQPGRLAAAPAGPFLTPGELYDDDWVIAPEPVRISPTHLRMYYSAKKVGPFMRNSWSLAVADSMDNGLTWKKYSGNPILTVTKDEWESGGVGFCSVEKIGDSWSMWYLGGNGQDDAKKQVGLATSTDGYNWTRYANNPVIAVDPQLKWESRAIAVPRVIRDDRLLRVWYCCYEHNNTYAIGQAESIDGKQWFRNPHNPVMQGSGQGFDSKMTAYPGVIRAGDRYLMWYSGDGYGKKGIGLATGKVPSGPLLFRSGPSAKPDGNWSSWQAITDSEPRRVGYIQFATVSKNASLKGK